MHAVDRAGRSVVARPAGPAPRPLHQAGPARADHLDVLDLQPGLCPGAERACLADRLGSDHEGRGDAAGGGRDCVQAVRGDLRQVPDRPRLRRVAPAAVIRPSNRMTNKDVRSRLTLPS